MARLSLRTANPWQPPNTMARSRIRDAATGRVLTQWFAHRGGVQCVKFTRDGRTLVTCGKDGNAKVSDVVTREVKATMAGQAEYLYSLDLSHDEKTLVTAGSDGTAVQWNVATGERKGEYLRNEGPVEVVRYSPNGTLFAVAGWDGVVNTLGHHDGVEGSSPARTRRRDPLAGLHTRQPSRGSRHRIGPVASLGRGVRERSEYERCPRWQRCAIAFSPDGKSMATAGHDRTVQIWDAPSAPVRRAPPIVRPRPPAGGLYLLSPVRDTPA